MKRTLSNLEIMILDIQATHADPEKGRVLEIGWAAVSASGYRVGEAAVVETRLIADTADTEIPRKVRRITGISDEDLAAAFTPEEAWRGLAEAAIAIARRSRRKRCPTVIHFARFEEPYLRQFHSRYSPDGNFPFDIICTHEIAKRLLPGLPRRGLRAVAGYFGHSVAELRRCGHHAAATLVIWRNLVDLLENRENIRTLGELRSWLKTTKASPRSGRAYPMDPEHRLGLPDAPGVYRMQRSNGDILYVGKARSLRKRVNSYFQKRTRHAEHILEMLTQAVTIDYTVAGSALEAALREADEIKNIQPPYDIALRNPDRSVRFATHDYTDFSHNPDDSHCIGPLISVEPFRQLAVLTGLLENGAEETGDEICLSALGLPQDSGPDIGCFREGFEQFREKHAAVLERRSRLKALIMLGTREWRRRFDECVSVPPDSDDDTDDTDDRKPDTPEAVERDDSQWTPETVVRILESSAIHAAHTLRRARWFCLLSESSLAWSFSDLSIRKKHLIVFGRGAIVSSRTVPPGKQVPPPKGQGQGVRERLEYFDVMTYDRMRIVTTELRRLVSEERTIELRVSPTVTMHRDGIGKMLRWV